jgi:branched-chain amino acid transport system permease protein
MQSNQLKKYFQSSIALGAIAALTVLIFGGWSGSVIGWLLGTAVGLTSNDGKRTANPLHGARLAVIPALGVGIWLLIASLLQGLWLLPASGQRSLSVSSAILFGLYSLIITVVAAVIMGAIQGLPSPRRQVATLFNIGAIAILFPFIDQIAQTRWIATMITVQIFVMLALGLNIVVGFAGLLDLGYAAFFAIGAYATGLLCSPHLGIQWNFWLVLPIAAVMAGIAGLILGAPTLRLRGDYVAIVTLGFGEIVPVVFRNLTSVRVEEPISKIIGTLMGHPEWAICLLGCDRPINLTAGEAGINPIGRPALPIIGTFNSSNYFPWYYLILFLVIFSYFMIGRLKDSRLGRSWTAIREDELAASAMGINLVQTKLLAFAMGATFSGFAGSFYASLITNISPSIFDFSVSVIILCMVILGGLGNSTGVILGGVIIMSADRLYLEKLAELLKKVIGHSVLPNVSNPQWQDFLATSIDPTQMRLFLFGLTLVIMMLVRPEGLLPDRIHQEELHGEDTEKIAEV